MRHSRQLRFTALVMLILAAGACSCVLPEALQRGGQVPQITATPSAVPSPAVSAATATHTTAPPTASATPILLPQYTENGVRICDYVPGVSVAAEMPPEVTDAEQPTPFPLPTPPPNTAVDQATIDRHIAIYQAIWDTVSERYYDPDFRGTDWAAVGDQYEALIQAGLTDEDFYLAMKLMIAELGDEHSSYLSPADVEAEEQFLQGTHDFVGIGAISLPTPEGEKSILLSIFPGSPAEEAGLRPHDALLAVDGGPVLDEMGNPRTLGPEGTQITVTVQRPGEPPRDVVITRRRVTGAWPIDYCIMPEQRIGYIFVPTFLDTTVDDQVAEALEKLTADGPLNGLILDNRMNSGGAGDVAGRFLGFFTEGLQGEFISRNGGDEMFIDAEDIGGSQTVPLVVLIGRDTASYGEITSGVLGNTGRATLIGETTLGNVELLRGTEFDDGSFLWIATDTFQPEGLSLGIWEETGIVPDIFAPVRWDLFVEGNDPGLAQAVEVLIP